MCGRTHPPTFGMCQPAVMVVDNMQACHWPAQQLDWRQPGLALQDQLELPVGEACDPSRIQLGHT